MIRLVEQSDALHERVRELALGRSGESFDDLALDIAEFQARHSPRFAKLWASTRDRRAAKATSDAVSRRAGSDSPPPSPDVDAIPAVPTDAFRLTRVAVHPPELDVVHFVTSGTTSEARGVHPMRTTATYELVALEWGRRALLARPTDHAALSTSEPPAAPPAARPPDEKRPVVVALAPEPDDPGDSSLGFMMRLFMQRFDGRALTPRWLLASEPLPDLPADSGRLVASGPRAGWRLGVDLPGLEHAADLARSEGAPLLLLATSFALVALLDALSGRHIAAPRGSVVMQTGGFKGKRRELEPAELRAGVARALCIDEAAVVGEYGMTELSSQLYEGTLPGGELQAEPGVYLPPPWLRVTAVDPATLEPVAEGEAGLARFVDLANVDSAVAIVTQDLVRRRGAGIELLGRRQGAPARGCSLAVEALVTG